MSFGHNAHSLEAHEGVELKKCRVRLRLPAHGKAKKQRECDGGAGGQVIVEEPQITETSGVGARVTVIVVAASLGKIKDSIQ